MENNLEGVTKYDIPSVFFLQNKLTSIVLEHFLKEKTFAVELNEDKVKELEVQLESYLKGMFSFKFDIIRLSIEERQLKGEVKIKDCPTLIFNLKEKKENNN